MIQSTKGNLLCAPVEALVNTVNTFGVMGKGLGGLQWLVVEPLIVEALAGIPNVKVQLFEPAPPAQAVGSLLSFFVILSFVIRHFPT